MNANSKPADSSRVPVLTEALDVPDLGEDVPERFALGSDAAPTPGNASRRPPGETLSLSGAEDLAARVADAVSQELSRRLPALVRQAVDEALARPLERHVSDSETSVPPGAD